MPTLLVLFGFRFVIYTNDHRPPHVHVIKSGCEIVVELETGRVVKNKRSGFKEAEIPRILQMVWKYQDLLLERWAEIHEEEKD